MGWASSTNWCESLGGLYRGRYSSGYSHCSAVGSMAFGTQSPLTIGQAFEAFFLDIIHPGR